MAAFIAYYRVSTDRQGASGLGLEAQRAAVKAFIGRSDKLIAEYKEVESGKRHDNRPQLLAALAECKKRKATLVIAKLDRLSRNVKFISTLMDGDVDLVCCDMPQATRLTLHIMAAMAEHEREMISTRTKAALAAAKKRGVRLGNPAPALARKVARTRSSAYRPPVDVMALLKDWRGQGNGFHACAAKLNALGIKALEPKLGTAAACATSWIVFPADDSRNIIAASSPDSVSLSNSARASASTAGQFLRKASLTSIHCSRFQASLHSGSTLPRSIPSRSCE